MKLKKLIEELSKFDAERDVVLFSNGYKEIKIVENEQGIIVAGKGMVCPSVKAAIENKGKEPEVKDLCFCLDASGDDEDAWL